MTATIEILREVGGFEYPMSADCTLDADGDVISKVSEDVREKYWSYRFGEPQIEFSGRFIFSAGHPISLKPYEIKEAKIEIAKLRSKWNESVSALKNVSKDAHRPE